MSIDDGEVSLFGFRLPLQYALLSDSCSSVGILTANVVIMLLTLGGFLYSSLQDRLVYSRTSGKARLRSISAL